MRSFLITLTAGAAALLLSGCPDIPGGPDTVTARSDAAWKASRPSHDEPAHRSGIHHSVSEIAWFQGTLDEAFSHRGCSESSPRRTLFRF